MSPPQEFSYVIFEAVKCAVKIRIYHYASDKICADVSLKMHQKRLTEPGPAGGAYSAAPDLIAGF